MKLNRTLRQPDITLMLSLIERHHGDSYAAYKSFISTHPHTIVGLDEFEELYDAAHDIVNEENFINSQERL